MNHNKRKRKSHCSRRSKKHTHASDTPESHSDFIASDDSARDDALREHIRKRHRRKHKKKRTRRTHKHDTSEESDTDSEHDTSVSNTNDVIANCFDVYVQTANRRTDTDDKHVSTEPNMVMYNCMKQPNNGKYIKYMEFLGYSDTCQRDILECVYGVKSYDGKTVTSNTRMIVELPIGVQCCVEKFYTFLYFCDVAAEKAIRGDRVHDRHIYNMCVYAGIAILRYMVPLECFSVGSAFLKRLYKPISTSTHLHMRYVRRSAKTTTLIIIFTAANLVIEPSRNRHNKTSIFMTINNNIVREFKDALITTYEALGIHISEQKTLRTLTVYNQDKTASNVILFGNSTGTQGVIVACDEYGLVRQTMRDAIQGYMDSVVLTSMSIKPETLNVVQTKVLKSVENWVIRVYVCGDCMRSSHPLRCTHRVFTSKMVSWLSMHPWDMVPKRQVETFGFSNKSLHSSIFTPALLAHLSDTCVTKLSQRSMFCIYIDPPQHNISECGIAVVVYTSTQAHRRFHILVADQITSSSVTMIDEIAHRIDYVLHYLHRKIGTQVRDYPFYYSGEAHGSSIVTSDLHKILVSVGTKYNIRLLCPLNIVKAQPLFRKCVKSESIGHGTSRNIGLNMDSSTKKLISQHVLSIISRVGASEYGFTSNREENNIQTVRKQKYTESIDRLQQQFPNIDQKATIDAAMAMLGCLFIISIVVEFLQNGARFEKSRKR